MFSSNSSNDDFFMCRLYFAVSKIRYGTGHRRLNLYVICRSFRETGKLVNFGLQRKSERG